jgi:hypothetical protein
MNIVEFESLDFEDILDPPLLIRFHLKVCPDTYRRGIHHQRLSFSHPLQIVFGLLFIVLLVCSYTFFSHVFSLCGQLKQDVFCLLKR